MSMNVNRSFRVLRAPANSKYEMQKSNEKQKLHEPTKSNGAGMEIKPQSQNVSPDELQRIQNIINSNSNISRFQ